MPLREAVQSFILGCENVKLIITSGAGKTGLVLSRKFGSLERIYSESKLLLRFICGGFGADSALDNFLEGEGVESGSRQGLREFLEVEKEEFLNVKLIQEETFKGLMS